MIKRIIALVLLALVLSSPAQARKHHAHRSHHASHVHSVRPAVGVITCDDRGCLDTRSYTKSTGRIAIANTSSLVERARPHMGQTASQLGLRRSLWCAAFMNMITNGGTGSDQAISYAHYGAPVSGPVVGAIAVMRHHVGVVSGVDPHGNPIIISGNHNHKVGEGVYPRSRVISYRM